MLLGWLSLPGAPAGAVQPQFWQLEGSAEFLAGELQGLTLDSDGHVRLAPETSLLHDPLAPYVWVLASDAKGTLYAGTGNEGKVWRTRDGRTEEFFKAPELEVHALTPGTDGRLYVGSSPDGKVYAVDAQGRAEPFFDPPEKYIWALASDARGRLLVATGEPARVYRVEPSGRAEVLLQTPETHFTALAVSATDVFVGSAPGGVLYRLTDGSRPFVLFDSAYREVKALGLGPQGTLYAALFDGSGDTPAVPAPAPPPSPAPPAAAGPQVTVSETFAVTALPPFSTAVAGPPPGTRGALVRWRDGDLETLWTSSEAAPHALLVRADGVLVGTGDKGQLFQVDEREPWRLLATFDAQQVTALAPLPGGAVALGTSNSGRWHRLGERAQPRGSFVSAVRDSGSVSAWGQAACDARLPEGGAVRLQTRSGNTAAADDTWSPWSEPVSCGPGAGGPVASPKARFLQVRLTLEGRDGGTPILDGARVAYLQRNLRPQVSALVVHPPGEVFQKPVSAAGDLEILGLDPGDEDAAVSAARSAVMAVTPYSRRLQRPGLQTLSWQAVDPNFDTLAYDLYYRRVEESRFRLLRAGLSDPVFAWDTSALPNGRYVAKLVARDTPSNPPELALQGEKESVPFAVDNTPPSLVAALVERAPVLVRVSVRDDASPLRRAEYALDGQRWVELHPLDGLNDSTLETYELRPAVPAAGGPHVLVVRVTDLLGNVATAQVEIP